MYSETHRLFKGIRTSTDIEKNVWYSSEAELFRECLGDNDPYELLQNRKWFTSFEGVYVRHDCLDHALITFLALKAQHEVRTT